MSLLPIIKWIKCTCISPTILSNLQEMMRSKEVCLMLVLAFAVFGISNANSEGDILNLWKTHLVDPDNVLQSWDPTLVNPCTWFHVACNIDNSVTRVDLGEGGLSGPLVPELGRLPNLQYLEVFGNKLSGTIPPQLGNLSKLISLDLYHNQFTGTIPAALGNLKSLKYMRLNSNKLTGVLPETVIQLISYGNLQILNVSENHLAGTVKKTKQTGFAVTTVVQDPKVALPLSN